MGVDWQRRGSGLFGGGISETWGMVVAEDRVLGGVFGQCMQAGMTGWATGYKAWSKRHQVWSKRPSGFTGGRVLGRVLSQCLQVGMTLVGELVTRLGVSGPRFGVSGHQASLGAVY